MVYCLVLRSQSLMQVSERSYRKRLNELYKTVRLHLGGVGRNVAEAAYRISTSKFQAHPSATVLVSSVGDDSFGRLILEEMRRTGMRTDGITTAPQRSAVCNMVQETSSEVSQISSQL